MNRSRGLGEVYAMEKKDLDVLLKAQQGELDAVLMYNALADVARDPEDGETFRRLAAEEGRHAAVFRELTGQTLRPKKTMAVLLPVLYRLIGRKRLYPLIARGEYGAVDSYGRIVGRYPQARSVRDDEKRHGDTVMALLEQQRR